jgi:hypothetical protein
MFNIVPPLFIILGLVGLVLLFNKKSSKENKIANQPNFEPKLIKRYSFFLKKWHQFFNKQNFELVKIKLSNFFEKVLIRLRIIILRLDYLLFRQLEKRKEKEKNVKDGLDQLKENNTLSVLTNTSHLELDNLSSLSPLDLEKEEKQFLTLFLKQPEEESSLVNLARLYLYRQDFSSARWALLEAHRLNKEDKVIRDLLLELQEKETPP